jgi:predicted transcriptional regulator
MAFALQYKIKTSGTNKPETSVSPSPNLSPLSIGIIEMMSTTTSERKNNRGKIQIMGDVLALGTSGIKKTHIMYKANLSYEQDVSSDGVVYRTTEKGREFLLCYTHLMELQEEEKQEPELEFSSPYISSRSWVR